MNSHRTPRSIAAYCLAILLLALPSSVAAQETPDSSPSEPGFELGLEDTVAAADLFDGEPGPKVKAVIADMLMAERSSWREVSADDVVAAQQTAPKQGDFGRWVKKRWYIPVLAAVVIGVAASGDSDTGGDDED